MNGRNHALACAVMLGAVLAPATRASAWGLATHRWIALRAVELSRCSALVADHGAELGDLALEPDTVLKERLGDVEAPRHFMDLDAYGPPPFTALPRDEAAAVARYGRAFVDRAGVLPWWGAGLARRLADEIASGRLDDARRTAGHLAHYASDATMPLHATVNHDGQRTGQRGIHKRIEARLVDDRLRAYVPDARRVGRRSALPRGRAAAALFDALTASYHGVAPVLAADRAARRGTRVGSDRYYRRLDADLHALLAARIGAAAALTAALWDGACGAR